MATVTWISNIASTWATAASWFNSTTGLNQVPVTGDDVVFNGSANGNCTYNASTSVQHKSLTTTGYAGILTISVGPFNMQNNSTFTLSNTHTFTGAGHVLFNGNTTITSGGCIIDVGMRTSALVATTIQIADNCSFSRLLQLQGTPTVPHNFISNIPNTQRNFTMLNTVNTLYEIDYTNFTDINNSAGITLWSYDGTIANCQNIFQMPPQPPTTSHIFV